MVRESSMNHIDNFISFIQFLKQRNSKCYPDLELSISLIAKLR